MNIAIDIRCLNNERPTGVHEYALKLSRLFLEKPGNNYFLFTNSTKKTNLPKKITEDYPTVKIIKTSYPNKFFNLFISFFKYPKLDRLIAKKAGIKNIDSFFSPNLNFISLSKQTRFILTIHDLSFELYPEFYSIKRRLWHRLISPKKLCERANKIICPSKNTENDLINIFKIDEKKIKIIPPGLSDSFSKETDRVKQEKVKQKYGLPDNFILHLGTIEPRKNIAGLVEAFEKACPKLKKEYILVLAGPLGWKTKKILQRINNSPLKDKIKIIGYIDEEDKPSLYALAKLFVYPSFYEGYGFPVLEAQASSIPVITSNRSSLPEIADKKTVLVNPNMISLLAEEIVKNSQ